MDLLSTSAAIVLFPLFLVLPGFCLGWSLNLVSFRQRTPLLRIVLSLPLSLSLTPVIIYLLGRQFSVVAVWAFWALIWAAFLAILILNRIRAGQPNPLSGKFPPDLLKPLTIISVTWIAVVVLSLVDLQLGSKLYFSAVSYDYTVRSAVISQLARAHWYPPANPFFFPGHPAPFRYHYFWFLVCSWVVRVAPGLIGPRHSLFAGVVWIGFSLMATVALALRFFNRDGHHLIRRRTLLAFGLLCVSGFDILPTLFLAFCRLKFHVSYIYPSVDWWNPDQVTGWLDSALWVPHHLAGMLACMTGFLILWVEWQAPLKRLRWQAVVAAGLAFASAGGLSVYVAFVFAAFLGIYTAVALLRRQYLEFVMLFLAGILALSLGAPFILELSAAGSAGTAGQGASFIRFGIRLFEPARLLLSVLHHDTPFSVTLADFVLLPLNFLIELGVLFLIGVIKLRQWMRSERPFTPPDLAAVMMVSVSLLISIFLRSNIISANDLGMRGMLIVQFVLVLWGADLLIDWRSHTGISRDLGIRFSYATLAAALALGAATNVYELFILRSFTLLTEAGMDPGANLINPGRNFAARAFFARQLYDWLDRRIPRSAIEQHNPFNIYDPVPGLYSDRQMGMSDPAAAIAFGGNPLEGSSMARSLRTLFEPGFPSANIDAVCERYKVDYLVVRSGDPIWNDARSWVWQRNPAYSNSMARAFACGLSKESPSVHGS